MVAATGADGVVFDIEGAEQVPNKTAASLTSLLAELRAKATLANANRSAASPSPVVVPVP